jgi:hypothetical protein
MCLGNDNKRDKHLHVAYGNSAYLMLPARGRLVPGHCVIAPIAHCDSSRNVDEGTWEEMRNFKKCLVLMFAKQGEECCFIETVRSGSGGSGGGGGLGARFAGSGGSSVAGNPKLPHTFVECVPLPRDVAESGTALRVSQIQAPAVCRNKTDPFPVRESSPRVLQKSNRRKRKRVGDARG